MKKRQLHPVWFLTILISFSAYQLGLAQTIKFEMGPEYKVEKRTEVAERFIHGDKSSSYLLWANYNLGSMWAHAYSFGAAKIKATASLQKFDAKMNQTFDKEFVTNEKDLNFEDVIWASGKFIMFTSKYDKATNTNTAYANFVDADAKIDAKSITVMKLTSDNKKFPGSFDFCVSDDSTKFLVYAQAQTEKEDNPKFVFDVYSTDMVKLWEKIVTLPYKERMVKIYDYSVSNNGDVFILLKKYDQDKKGWGKNEKKTDQGVVANYNYEVLVYTNGGKDYKEYTLDLNGKFVVDPAFKIDPKGNLAVAGFYTDILGGAEKGIFYMTIDAESKQVKTSNMKEFTKEMIDAIGKNHNFTKTKGKDQGLKFFVFNKFILRNDGGAVLLAENQYVNEYTVTDEHGMTRTEYTYYYNDIIAINVNPKGEIEWFSRVPKRQFARERLPYLSYSPMVVGDKIYLIYNDNKNNTEDEAKPKYFNYKDGVAVITTIDANGKITKKNLFGLKDNETILYPRNSSQTSSNKMSVFMAKGKNYRIGYLTVE